MHHGKEIQHRLHAPAMIRKIQRIKNFGVYADYQWPAELPVFNRYNLIYGWYYSGKTTLSRVLRCFELKQPHIDFVAAEANLECEDGTVHRLAAPANAPALRVFNSDFVLENLSFGRNGGNANPILILGQEDIEKQRALEAKKLERDKLQQVIDQKRLKKTAMADAIETAKTAKARDIKKTLSHPDYDKTRLGPKIGACITNPEQHLLNDEDFGRTLNTYRSTEKKSLLSEQTDTLALLGSLKAKVATLLEKTVTAQTIKRFEDNSALESWVKVGRTLHAEKTTCEFCGSPLPADLLTRLAGHFSRDYENFMNDLKAVLQEIEQATYESVALDDEARFYPEVASQYAPLKAQLESWLKQRQANLNILTASVSDKQTKAFTKCICPDIDDPSDQIQTTIASINATIRKHNLRTDEFEKERTAAFAKFEMHCAAQFVTDQKYTERLKEISDLGNTIEAEAKQIQELNTAIQTLEQQISEIAKGAERINSLLFAYFAKNDLRIEVSPEKRFHLKRGGVPAKNLSEGEKTAIAFAYFFTCLSDRSTNLAETIVVIDDPVSSLDANHLFNTVALIKTFLADCKQVIISTHNYEFFNLIRDWFMEVEDLKKPHKDLLKWRAFLVELSTPSTSILREIPLELIKFKSEYHYLFSVLHRFALNPSGDFSQLFNLPNVTRRFMEAFGGIMIPSHTGLHKKMERLFPEPSERERVWKFVNHYSHNVTIIRSLTIPDTSECSAVVASCLAAVQKWNNEHYDALVGAIS